MTERAFREEPIAVVHTKLLLPVTALVAVAVATVVMWIVMVLVSRRKDSSYRAWASREQDQRRK